MTKTIIDIDVFVIEYSLTETLQGSALLHDIIAFMAIYNFVIYDVVKTGRRPLDTDLDELDFVFVQKNSIFCSDKRWDK